MIYAVIDLGSNTIRMNVYRLRNGKFRLLFSKKATVGIVSYVKEGRLSREGVMEICSTLDAFRKVLEHLQIDHCSVFATASLRNIDNTEEVIEQVRKKTGMTIRLISGEEEGRLSFHPAQREERHLHRYRRRQHGDRYVRRWAGLPFPFLADRFTELI